EPLLYYSCGVVFFSAERGCGYKMLEQLHGAAEAFIRRHCTSVADSTMEVPAGLPENISARREACAISTRLTPASTALRALESLGFIPADITPCATSPSKVRLSIVGITERGLRTSSRTPFFS